jgi:tetratricopeptide (TPR) repeat protein
MDSSAQILFKNALHHIQLKEFDSAGVLLHKALASSPDDPDILRILSVNFALQFKFDDALELIDRVISLSPKNALAHSNRGNILKELGRYDEALQALDMAIKLSPTYPEAYSNMGNVLQEMFRYEESLEWYDKAIKLNPQYAEAYSNKGNAFQYMGQFEEALHWFNKSTAINFNYVDGYWLKAMAQLPMGNFEDGFQNYEARWFKSNPVFLSLQTYQD